MNSLADVVVYRKVGPTNAAPRNQQAVQTDASAVPYEGFNESPPLIRHTKCYSEYLKRQVYTQNAAKSANRLSTDSVAQSFPQPLSVTCRQHSQYIDIPLFILVCDPPFDTARLIHRLLRHPTTVFNHHVHHQVLDIAICPTIPTFRRAKDAAVGIALRAPNSRIFALDMAPREQ